MAEFDEDFKVSFWRSTDLDKEGPPEFDELDKIARPSLAPCDSSVEASAPIKAACQLGLLGAILPSTLNSTISLSMSNLNFQLVLARQHRETLQQCAQNWQAMQRDVLTLSDEIAGLAAESKLHNFHLPVAPQKMSVFRKS